MAQKAASRVLVVDLGACYLKAGYSDNSEPKLIPNSVIKAKNERRRVFVADQIEECKDYSTLFYHLPFQRGYLSDWEVEHQILDHVFGKERFKVDYADTRLLLTEPYFNFKSIREALDEIVFEEYGFHSALRITPASLSMYKYMKENPPSFACVIVDSGYSFTHVVPYFKGRQIKKGILRTNVGGKLLTNYLKEVISYRQLHVMDETYVMNQCKEDVCYVSNDFYRDLKICSLKGADNTIMREYVLPDFSTHQRGYLRIPNWENVSATEPSEEQVLRINHERFTVPELLFHPSDISMKEMGISEALVHSVLNRCTNENSAEYFNNILLTGGNCLFEGIKERITNDVRSMAPSRYDVRVTLPPNPISYAWEGGVALSQDQLFPAMCVTKAEYFEHGQNICAERFVN